MIHIIIHSLFIAQLFKAIWQKLKSNRKKEKLKPKLQQITSSLPQRIIQFQHEWSIPQGKSNLKVSVLDRTAHKLQKYYVLNCIISTLP